MAVGAGGGGGMLMLRVVRGGDGWLGCDLWVT